MKKNRPRCTPGFTIIELVTVILVIGIISVMAVPKLFNTSSYRARFFYDDVLSSFRYAQKLALSSGCHIQVSTTSTTLTLNKRASCTSGTFTVAVRDPTAGATTYVQTAPSGVTISTTDTPLYFDSMGRCRRSSDASIASYTVTVGGKVINIIGESGLSYDPTL